VRWSIGRRIGACEGGGKATSLRQQDLVAAFLDQERG
jgi:hypothetical protein